MSPEEFESVVARALDRLPADVKTFMDNVVVIIEDEPSPDELEDLGLDPDEDTLFGLYQGSNLLERGATYGNALPDRIVIYRLPLLEGCEDRAELVREIRDTVIHEVGHFVGLEEEDLP